jgi:hypothetical protein
MPTPHRRRGGQPGNQNALKHGLYRKKPAPGERARGGQPGNLNALVQGGASRLPSPAPFHRAAPSFRPPLRYRSDLPAPGPSVLAQPPGWLNDRLTRLETGLLLSLEDPYCSYDELIFNLRGLDQALAQLLDELFLLPPDDPPSPERKLQ